MQPGEDKKCCCPCHMAGGILIVLIGLAFLLNAFDVIGQRVLSITWPILLMLYGAKKACKGKCKCCPEACKKD